MMVFRDLSLLKRHKMTVITQRSLFILKVSLLNISGVTLAFTFNFPKKPRRFARFCSVN